MEFEPKIFRKIIFIRHGQYTKEPECLTKIGIKQAILTANAISQLKPTKIYCSTMPRAIETANIINKRLNLKIISDDAYREGLLPGTIDFQNFMSKDLNQKEKKKMLTKAKNAKKIAVMAFKKLVKIPNQGQNIEIVVAHGNVIRFWVCKALGIPENKWLKMDVSHASITTIRISKSGKIVLLGFADSGHLPIKLRTYI